MFAVGDQVIIIRLSDCGAIVPAEDAGGDARPGHFWVRTEGGEVLAVAESDLAPFPAVCPDESALDHP